MPKKFDLKTAIRDVPDFPKKGILFKDITTLLENGELFQKVIDELADHYKSKKIEKVIGIESRGFIFGAALAYKLKAGVIPIRKKGKLPYKTISATYALEYGSDTLEMHEDAVKKGTRVLIVDDLLATGGTARATCDLVSQLGGQVHAVACLIELVSLKGRDKLAGQQLHSVLQY